MESKTGIYFFLVKADQRSRGIIGVFETDSSKKHDDRVTDITEHPLIFGKIKGTMKSRKYKI